MPSYVIPTAQSTIAPTDTHELNGIVARLDAAKANFATLGIDARIELLDRLAQGVLEVADGWVAAALEAKGIDPASPTSSEEWLGGPMAVLRNIRLLQRSLADIRKHGVPKVSASRLSNRNDGRLVVEVFPDSTWDKVLFGGFSAEVWMEAGVDAGNLAENQAEAYRNPDPNGRVALVLGAGNVASIGPMDVLHKLFVENQTVVLKMNPVNEYLGPFIRQAFAPLVEQDWCEVVYGGAEVGSHLVEHDGIAEIHITGSDATHDAIVWGPADSRDERKASGQPLMDKPITSELGNVTPVVVVPGQWTPSQLAFQAENVASMVANNASFNCNAAKLLVTATGWEQRDEFLTLVRSALSRVPVRCAYYPGARDRWQAFLDAHPEAELLTDDDGTNVPWTFIGGLDPDAGDEMCFTREPFCGVLHEVSLPGNAIEDFLPAAVAFCNDRVWGTLAISLLVPPSARKAATGEATFQAALDDLRYGSIAVNHWAALCYAISNTTWGAHPGHPLDDIQSGRGFVHNIYMFDRPLKSVVYGPIKMAPKPPWFVTHRTAHLMAPELTRFEARPSAWKLPSIVAKALRG